MKHIVAWVGVGTVTAVFLLATIIDNRTLLRLSVLALLLFSVTAVVLHSRHHAKLLHRSLALIRKVDTIETAVTHNERQLVRFQETTGLFMARSDSSSDENQERTEALHSSLDAHVRRTVGTLAASEHRAESTAETLLATLAKMQRRSIGVSESVREELNQLVSSIDERVASLEEFYDIGSARIGRRLQEERVSLSHVVLNGIRRENAELRGELRAALYALQSDTERLRSDVSSLSADFGETRDSNVSVHTDIHRDLQSIMTFGQTVRDEFKAEILNLSKPRGEDSVRRLETALASLADEVAGLHSYTPEPTSSRLRTEAASDAAFSSEARDTSPASRSVSEPDLIRDDIRKAAIEIVHKLTIAGWDDTRQVEALLQLYSGFNPRTTMPPTGRHAMDARSLLQLLEVVKEKRPRTILELGGGTSTVWLAYLCEQLGARLISVDHESTFLSETKRNIEAHALDKLVDFRLAPLTEYTIGGEKYQWYDRNTLQNLEAVDLLLVDGPPGGTNDFARYPALPFMRNTLSDSATVILDDSDRPDETAILERWADAFPEFTWSDSALSRLAIGSIAHLAG